MGGIAKDYAADSICELLSSYRVEGAILDLGGNVLALGNRTDGTPWRVAVRDPFHTESQLCTLLVSDQALVTSGAYERYFACDGVRYHLIMDPKLGRPAQSDFVSVTVIANDATYADVLSTALFVMSYEDAAAYWREVGDFEAIFVVSTGEVYITQGVVNLLLEPAGTFHLIT